MEEQYIDQDQEETREWLEALDAVIRVEGPDKARYLMRKLEQRLAARGVSMPLAATTPYRNTIPPQRSQTMPGNTLVARNVAACVRWNAMAMVVRANRDYPGIGGHISTYASASSIYEVGFDYFFRGWDAPQGADLVYFQGHASPGMYARAFVEGVLDEEQLIHFRREASGKGLSSYPHPWLMPGLWQFPTVSMGLGPITALYQARFMKYLHHRGLVETDQRKVWAFLGDGEMDEPESRGAISLASREKLDNLIYVINCNLQRLDGPVRGNGKIIQELEGVFRGAGWNVIKVLWGSEWDPILERDREGVLIDKLGRLVDGELQTMAARGPAYIRETLFSGDPRLEAIVKDVSDRELWQMSRGGHDPRKVYAAFAEAIAHREQPTLILMQTVKGYGLGKAGESINIAHNVKKLDSEALMVFRDRFHVPLEDDQLDALPFIRPPQDSEEGQFIRQQREKLGGFVPNRKPDAPPLAIPSLDSFAKLLQGSDKPMSTTMGFVRLISQLAKDKNIGKHLVPIVADEARTFGMEGLFRQLGIYSPLGQLYEPEDAGSVLWYKEDAKGQVLEEGISEAGAISSWIAAGTAHANYGLHMIPFYIYYSMFGFQRIGDLAWAAADSRARGFLLGATSGRTTLNGEGLQHQDGHSHLLAATIPNCLSYDPAFVYELVVIIQDGLRRMFAAGEDVFYYVTMMNENYAQPTIPEGAEEGIRRGMYLFRAARKKQDTLQLLGSGAILNEVIAAADLLHQDFGIHANVWSVPGINQLHRDAIACERHNRCHPADKAQTPWVSSLLGDRQGPTIIATDYLRAWPEQIRRLLPKPCTILGTDGFGRSDTREVLRDFFEVDRRHIVLAALAALRDAGRLEHKLVEQVIKKYGIDRDKPNPLTN